MLPRNIIPLFRVSAIFAIFVLTSLVKAADEPIRAYYASRIWTGDAAAIDDAVLVVKGARIVSVGRTAEVSVPENAERIDLPAVLIPGLVIAETGLGDVKRDDERSLTPEVRAIDGFDFFGDYTDLLAGGVTTVQLAPGSQRLMPGQGAVVKLAGEDIEDRMLVRRGTLRVILSQQSRNPPRIFSPPAGAVSVGKPLTTTRPQLGSTLGGAVAGLRAVFRAANEYAAKDTGNPDQLLGAVARYLRDDRVIRITARNAAEIRAAVRLAEEFGLKVLLVDPVELRSFADSMESWQATIKGVILNVGLRSGRITNVPIPDRDGPPSLEPWDNARMLLRRGFEAAVALRPAADEDLTDMLFLGGLFARGGNTREDVLRMLTLAPARLLGTADRVGSLSAGKDADFVVLSGDPFALHTRVLATYVNGTRFFDRDKNSTATVINSAAIYKGDGTVLKDASIVIAGRKIRGIGPDVSRPPDARTRQFKNAVVVPGFIDLAANLGLGGALTGTVPVQAKLGDRLMHDDPSVSVARQGGVTTVLLGSTGTSPGPVVAFKLGEKLRVIRDPVALRFAISGNLTTAVPSVRRTLSQAKAYDESWKKYDAQLGEYEKKLKEYEAAKAKYEASQKAKDEKEEDGEAQKGDATKKSDSREASKGQSEGESDKDESTKQDSNSSGESEPPTEPKAPTKPKLNSGLEPYRALFAGKIPALVDARKANDLRAAIKLFRDEFKLRMVVVGGDDAFRFPELLAEKEVAVAIGPEMVREVESREINLAQVFANRQIPFGFQSRATTGVKTLPLAVQYAVHKGLGGGDAIAAMTRLPATFLSLQSSIGTLEIGKDADLVVLSGKPFELSTQVLAVMIDGEWVFEKEEKP